MVKQKKQVFFNALLWLCDWYIETIELRENKLDNEIKRKLKYFIPTITTDFLGNKKVNWTLREKPLTDEELQILINS